MNDRQGSQLWKSVQLEVSMENRAKELHEQAIVVDGHNHIMMELSLRRNRGERNVFSNYYTPRIRKGEVEVPMENFGGHNTCLTIVRQKWCTG